jgi:activator of HSP90 ATPase
MNQMKNFSKEYRIKSSLENVYQALTQPEIIGQWSGAKAQMDLSPGGKFSLWNGSIFGNNLEVSQNKIVQDWQTDDWDAPTKVTFLLTEDDGEVLIKLQHQGIPDKSYKSISKGWDGYYMGPLKDLLESKG